MLNKSIKLPLFISFCVLMSFNLSYAKVTVNKIEVEGSASTYSGAITNALVQAISQVKGVKVSSQSSITNRLNLISYNDGDKKGSVGTISKSLAEKVSQATDGSIQSYKVNDSNKSDGKYEVNLLVDVAKNVSDDANDRLPLKRVAILPFEVSYDAISINGVSRRDIATSMQQGLVNQFTQSRKFKMVNRTRSDQASYLRESKIISSDQTDSDDNYKLGNKTNADYILTGRITSFNIVNKKTHYYGENFSKYSVTATVSYRLMNLATMEIKWSNTVTQTLSSAVANKYIDDNNGSYVGVENYLFKQLSKTIADQVIGVAYPLTVLKVLDGDVYLSQGGDRVQRGTVYKIFKRGTVVTDHATGQLITVAGKNVATIRISGVMPKYSIGQLISGSSLNIMQSDKAYFQN